MTAHVSSISYRWPCMYPLSMWALQESLTPRTYVSTYKGNLDLTIFRPPTLNLKTDYCTNLDLLKYPLCGIHIHAQYAYRFSLAECVIGINFLPWISGSERCTLLMEEIWSIFVPPRHSTSPPNEIITFRNKRQDWKILKYTGTFNLRPHFATSFDGTELHGIIL